MKKHHPVNYSVSKDDAGSSEGSGGATHLQRLFQALKGLTGDTRGAQELVDCWASPPFPGKHRGHETVSDITWITGYRCDSGLSRLCVISIFV